jgi:hypothetical protein
VWWSVFLPVETMLPLPASWSSCYVPVRGCTKPSLDGHLGKSEMKTTTTPDLTIGKLSLMTEVPFREHVCALDPTGPFA